jgi:hypothetical protein
VGFCAITIKRRRDGVAAVSVFLTLRDKARFPKFTNCWAKGLSSHVSDPLAYQSIVDPALSRRESA